MLKKLYSLLIFTSLITIYDAKYFKFKFNMYNVTKFMDTSLKIWTYNTTKRTNLTCLVDAVYNISRESVYFNRSYRSGLEWSQFSKEGLFDARDQRLMMVRRPGGLVESTEILEFANDNYTCGIFRVWPGGGHGLRLYDLRFKDYDKWDKPDQVCIDEFNR
uniref:Putative lipocalin n=1 Tax=Rhipicephalus microplus TaxID=6941 RepID=A0A6G5A5D5_RHIMP